MSRTTTFLYFTLFLCLSDCVLSHTYLSSVSISGVKQTSCIRSVGTNSPITSVTSNDMMCGFLPKGAQPATSKCSIAAGSKIGLQWNHESTAASDMIIDDSHKGPCLAYLSRDNGANWFKIYEKGYDQNTKTFCVTTLKDTNKGYMEVTIPYDIAPGNYLIRGELIALHGAYDVGGAQPYVTCAELSISGSGNAKPSNTVTFPGAYKPEDPGLYINIYNPIPNYVIPGPAIYVPGGSTPASSGASTTSSGSSTTSSTTSSGATKAPNTNTTSGVADANKQEGGANVPGSSSNRLSTGAAVGIACAVGSVAIVAAVLAVVVYKHQKDGHVLGRKLWNNKENSNFSSTSTSSPSTSNPGKSVHVEAI